jgi:hypothetical protein
MFLGYVLEFLLGLFWHSQLETCFMFLLTIPELFPANQNSLRHPRGDVLDLDGLNWSLCHAEKGTYNFGGTQEQSETIFYRITDAGILCFWPFS